MSTASKATLLASAAASVGIIAYVCIKQQYDRQKLRESVWQDFEKQQRKTENIYNLQQQIDLGKRLKLSEEREQAAAITTVK